MNQTVDNDLKIARKTIRFIVNFYYNAELVIHHNYFFNRSFNGSLIGIAHGSKWQCRLLSFVIMYDLFTSSLCIYFKIPYSKFGHNQRPVVLQAFLVVYLLCCGNLPKLRMCWKQTGQDTFYRFCAHIPLIKCYHLTKGVENNNKQER